MSIQPTPIPLDRCVTSVEALIVAPEPTLRQLVAAVLEEEELATTCVATGQEALTIYMPTTPAVMVIDAQLPDLDAGLVIEALRARFGRPIPLLLLAPEPYPPTLGVEWDRCQVVAKPLDPDDLTDALWCLVCGCSGVA